MKIICHGEYIVEGLTPSELDGVCDQIMAELLKLEESGCPVSDSSVSATLSTGRIEIDVVGEGDTFDEAANAATSSIRTAFHATGGSTPGWEAEANRFAKQVLNMGLVDA